MTIQKAVKSGKPFKRKGESDDMYIFVNEASGRLDWFDGFYNPLFAALTKDDILAMDWETKP